MNFLLYFFRAIISPFSKMFQTPTPKVGEFWCQKYNSESSLNVVKILGVKKDLEGKSWVKYHILHPYISEENPFIDTMDMRYFTYLYKVS